MNQRQHNCGCNMSNRFVSIVAPILPPQAYPAFAGRNKQVRA
jgi:hypothetical protein